MESAALTAPLAGSVGGTASHTGGKPWATTADPAWQTLAAWVRGRRFGGLALPLGAGPDYVFQVSDADGVYVIDAGRREVIGLVEGAESAGGVAADPNGRRVYVSNPARSTLDVIDFKTLAVFKRILLSGRPSDVASSKDGSKIYVGIEQGAVDVIDSASLTRVNTITLGGPVAGVFSTPDGTHLIAVSPESPILTVLDLDREAISWTLKLDANIEPAVAFVPNGDGSTRDILFQLQGLRGFAVVDFATRTEMTRIHFPAGPGRDRKALSTLSGGGIVVSSNLDYPNERMLWTADQAEDSVVAFGVPERCYPRRTLQPGERCDWEVLGSVEVGAGPSSLTPAPDSKTIYVAVSDADQTAAIDVAKMTVVDRVPVGRDPGRNLAATMKAN